MKANATAKISKAPEASSIREMLMDAGWTIRRFAIEHHYKVSTAYAAANRSRNGVAARRIRKHMERIASNAKIHHPQTLLDLSIAEGGPTDEHD